MELRKLEFPKRKEEYLRDLFVNSKDGVGVRVGTVILKKGQRLPYKSLDYNEFAYLFSGHLLVSTLGDQEIEMLAGDILYLDKEEIRETVTLEDTQLIFFLFKQEVAE